MFRANVGEWRSGTRQVRSWPGGALGCLVSEAVQTTGRTSQHGMDLEWVHAHDLCSGSSSPGCCFVQDRKGSVARAKAEDCRTDAHDDRLVWGIAEHRKVRVWVDAAHGSSKLSPEATRHDAELRRWDARIQFDVELLEFRHGIATSTITCGCGERSRNESGSLGTTDQERLESCHVDHSTSCHCWFESPGVGVAARRKAPICQQQECCTSFRHWVSVQNRKYRWAIGNSSAGSWSTRVPSIVTA